MIELAKEPEKAPYARIVVKADRIMKLTVRSEGSGVVGKQMDFETQLLPGDVLHLNINPQPERQPWWRRWWPALPLLLLLAPAAWGQQRFHGWGDLTYHPQYSETRDDSCYYCGCDIRIVTEDKWDGVYVGWGNLPPVGSPVYEHVFCESCKPKAVAAIAAALSRERGQYTHAREAQARGRYERALAERRKAIEDAREKLDRLLYPEKWRVADSLADSRWGRLTCDSTQVIIFDTTGVGISLDSLKGYQRLYQSDSVFIVRKP